MEKYQNILDLSKDIANMLKISLSDTFNTDSGKPHHSLYHKGLISNDPAKVEKLAMATLASFITDLKNGYKTIRAFPTINEDNDGRITVRYRLSK